MNYIDHIRESSAKEEEIARLKGELDDLVSRVGEQFSQAVQIAQAYMDVASKNDALSAENASLRSRLEAVEGERDYEEVLKAVRFAVGAKVRADPAAVVQRGISDEELTSLALSRALSADAIPGAYGR